MDIIKWLQVPLMIFIFSVTLSKKLPIEVNFDTGGKPVLSENEKRNISCGFANKDGKELEMIISSKPAMTISLYRDQDYFYILANGRRDWVQIKKFPDRNNGITIFKPFNRITVAFTGIPRYNGCKVKCIAKSEDGKTIIGEAKTTLTIRWEPTVRQFLLYDRIVIANRQTYITCVLQYGDSSSSNLILTNLGENTNTTREDENGYRVVTLGWWKSFTTADNGKILTCGFQGGANKEIRVNVQVAPHSLTISPKNEVSRGGKISCTSKGKPAPNVTLRMTSLDGKVEKETVSPVSTAELTVPKTAEGNYRLVCIAGSSAGVKRRETSISVKRAPYLLKISHKNEILAGKKISCSAKGHPAPNVLLSISGYHGAKGEEFVSGVSTAKLTVPATAEGKYIFNCTATNSAGGENTDAVISVKQDSIGMSIDVPISLKPIISIICKPTRKTKRVKFDVQTEKESESFNITVDVNGNHFRKIGKTPLGLKHNSSGTLFTVSFPSERRYNDAKVICSGEIMNRTRSVSKRIKLHKSKLSRMYVTNETNSMTVVCEVNIGSIIENLNVTISASNQPYFTSKEIPKNRNESLVNFTSTISMNVNRHEILCLLGNQRLNHRNVLWNYIVRDSTNVKSPSKPADSNTIFIIGGVGGGVVVILLAVSLIICRRRICECENNRKTPEIMLAGPVTSIGTNLMIENPSEQRHGAENNSDDHQTSADTDTSTKLSSVLPKLKFQVNINNSVTVVDDSQHHVAHGASAHGNRVVEELKMTGDVKKNAPNVYNNNVFVDQSPAKQVESESTEEDLIYADLDFSNTMVPQSSNTYYDGTAIKPKKPPKPSRGVKPPDGISSGDYCVDKTEECPDDADIYSEIIGVIV